MKHSLNCQKQLRPPVFCGIRIVLIICVVFVGGMGVSTAATNPYEAIKNRNVFGIKPPVPALPPPPVQVPAPEIKLQGITTILGRKLVMFRAKLPAKPPEQPAPKDVSLMLSEGQREGEIEVLEINEINGSAKLRNYGVEQTLTLRDNADKPVQMAVSAPVVPQPGMPGIVPPPNAQPGLAPAPDVIKPRGIPTRPTRASPSPLAGGITPAAPIQKNGPTPETMMSSEEQTVIIETHRKLHENDPNYPPLPPTEITPNPK